MIPTVKTLRQSGYKVRVYHERKYLQQNKFSPVCILSSKGGKTTVEITTPDKERDVFGIAFCSDADNFSKKLGTKIATGRALAQLETQPILPNV